MFLPLLIFIFLTSTVSDLLVYYRKSLISLLVQWGLVTRTNGLVYPIFLYIFYVHFYSEGTFISQHKKIRAVPAGPEALWYSKRVPGPSTATIIDGLNVSSLGLPETLLKF